MYTIKGKKINEFIQKYGVPGKETVGGAAVNQLLGVAYCVLVSEEEITVITLGFFGRVVKVMTYLPSDIKSLLIKDGFIKRKVVEITLINDRKLSFSFSMMDVFVKEYQDRTIEVLKKWIK